MELRPSSVPLRVPLPPPPASSLPAIPDPESDLAHAASSTVPRLLATVVTDPSFESTATYALVALLVDFAAACCLDYATSLVAESESDCPPSVRGECAFGTYILEDRQEEFEYLTAAIPHLVAMLLVPEGDPDAPDISTPRSYTEAITVSPSGADIVDGMWIFRVKRPMASPPVFKARYVAEVFSHQQGVDFFQNFSPTPNMTIIRGSLHEEIWLRRPPSFTRSFLAGTQWSLRRPVYSLHQAPREWHDTQRMMLAALGFAPSTADPLLFLRTDTLLPPFYILLYVDDLVFATADTKALALVKSELQKRHTCTDLGEMRSYLGLHITRDRARHTITLTQSHMVHQVLSALASGTPRRSPLMCLPVTRSQLHLQTSPSICEDEIYAGAMAAQVLRWLTFLLNNLGEWPRSSLVLYVDNKAMIAFCQEHRLEHRTKHIALRYFFARELQQRGQLRLAYMATQTNTADIFTKALLPGDHQRVCTVLGLVPTLPLLLTA
ncbi:unnamed protein product [Closterium sp. NIES-53]